jgi:uncharacterized Rmd1/YagE family protein
MSEDIRIVAVAVKNSINLAAFAKGIDIKEFENWKACLELDETIISTLLRYEVKGACVLLYKMGAIVLVGLDENQEQDLLSKLELFLQIDYLKRMHLFNDYDYCKPYEVYTKAEAMARSIRLKWLEMQVDDLMEQAEPLLIKIGKGSKRGYTPKFRQLVAKAERFELESIGILAMLGRPYQGVSKEIYEKYIGEYDIKERLTVINEKLSMLQGITSAHELFGRFIGWQRLLIIEAILLVCFPIPGLMSLNLIDMWQRVYKWIHLFLS